MKGASLSVLTLLTAACATDGYAQATFDAMLLPPVDSQITFYADQPGYFALIGIARDSSVHLVYHDALFSRLDDDGYIFVPKRDTGYARIYFLASSTPLDLSALKHKPSTYALDQAIASALIVEGYDLQPKRQFFTLANPAKRDAVALSLQRGMRFADAYEALHPIPAPRKRGWFVWGSPPRGNEGGQCQSNDCYYYQYQNAQSYSPDYGSSPASNRPVIESSPIGAGPPSLPSSPTVHPH
jgi:hypothetical protein